MAALLPGVAHPSLVYHPVHAWLRGSPDAGPVEMLASFFARLVFEEARLVRGRLRELTPQPLPLVR